MASEDSPMNLCGIGNPFVPVDEKRRRIKCDRPERHTRLHKARGRVWDETGSKWAYQKRKGR